MLLSSQILLVKREFAGFDDEAPALRHGVTSVYAEIHNDLFDLRGVGPNNRKFGSKLGPDFDIAIDEKNRKRLLR
jgi:hypothetical protein